MDILYNYYACHKAIIVTLFNTCMHAQLMNNPILSQMHLSSGSMVTPKGAYVGPQQRYNHIHVYLPKQCASDHIQSVSAWAAHNTIHDTCMPVVSTTSPYIV